MRDFARVESWIFDLDNTLYPASCRLFDQIDQRIGEYVSNLMGIEMAEAKALQKQMFYRHGTTLRGLMLEHQVNSSDFLSYVHDIDHSPVKPDAQLAAAIAGLPGRKLVFTSGTTAHAQAVMARLGITDHFEDIFDIVRGDFIPKPNAEPYAKFLNETGVDPKGAAMFEDLSRNLEEPHRLGMTTVLVTSDDNDDAQHLNGLKAGEKPAHVDYLTHDLAGFLKTIKLQ